VRCPSGLSDKDAVGEPGTTDFVLGRAADARPRQTDQLIVRSEWLQPFTQQHARKGAIRVLRTVSGSSPASTMPPLADLRYDHPTFRSDPERLSAERAPPPDPITGWRGTSWQGTTEPIRNLARVQSDGGQLANPEPRCGFELSEREFRQAAARSLAGCYGSLQRLRPALHPQVRGRRRTTRTARSRRLGEHFVVSTQGKPSGRISCLCAVHDHDL